MADVIQNSEWKEIRSVSVRDFGAAGDGVTDDYAAVQRALDAGADEVIFPAGQYLIGSTLKVHSFTTILAQAGARIIHSKTSVKKRGDFLLSNSDPLRGNSDITIRGGIWDGNFDPKTNTKCGNGNIFEPMACSGSVLNFVNIRGLVLEDMEIANSVVYFIRMGKLNGFIIRNIRFSAVMRSFNQDGLHFGGECYNGLIENIRAITDGETNDDMIALNADDCITRQENRDLTCGPIENIVIRDVYAKDCYTAVRMLSVHSPIRNIVIENMTCGVRCYAINMDCARRCGAPLVKEGDFPDGCGCIENIEIRNLKIYFTIQNLDNPLIGWESLSHHFVIENVTRLIDQDKNMTMPLLCMKNVTERDLTYTDETGTHRKTAQAAEDHLTLNGAHYDLIRVDKNPKVR